MSVEKIQNKYNPEKDMIPGGPDVNWVDMELLSLIEGIQKRCERLENEMRQLRVEQVVTDNWLTENLPQTIGSLESQLGD